MIDEVRSEQLDIVPAHLRVRVTRRPRYACRACEGAVVVAPAPERPIDGGMATEAMIAHVLVSKFCDSLPLYRQSKMLERQGITLDRSTLSHWVGRACWWLTPLYELMLSTALSAPKLFADDTTLPVLDPGRGKTKTGRLWCYAVDDRPWRGPGHPVAAYVYTEDRKNIRPATHLSAFRGVLQVDGYAGFKRLAGDRADASVTLAFCWAHLRRPFYQFHASTQSPLAAAVLAKIGALYAIEAEIRGHPAEHRRQVRQARSRPIVEALHAWLQEHVGRVSATSDLADAIRYALRHWPGLTAYPRRRPDRDGHQRRRAGHQADNNHPQEFVVRGQRWRGPALGDRHDTDPIGKVERCRADGIPDRCAGAHCLRAHQSLSAGSAAAVELEGQRLPFRWSRWNGRRHEHSSRTHTDRKRTRISCGVAGVCEFAGGTEARHVRLGTRWLSHRRARLPELDPSQPMDGGPVGRGTSPCSTAPRRCSRCSARSLACTAVLNARIQQSLRRLEAEKVCDYRPAFQPDVGPPPRDAVTTWVRGFWKAMSLAPADWAALIKDQRTQVLVAPFVGFMDRLKDDAFEPAPDIDEQLDEAAADIPRAILLLRKIAELRASRPSWASSQRPSPTRSTKVGRNDPCPCGSGKKFKRCCGMT